MKKLLKYLVCMTLIFILSTSIIFANDEDDGIGIQECSQYIENILENTVE